MMREEARRVGIKPKADIAADLRRRGHKKSPIFTKLDTTFLDMGTGIRGLRSTSQGSPLETTSN